MYVSDRVRISVFVCLLYLSEPSLAVSDVGPVFAGQAVRQFVLPDKCSVLSTRAALQPSCTLGNNAAHRLGHTEVHLQHKNRIITLCTTEARQSLHSQPYVTFTNI